MLRALPLLGVLALMAGCGSGQQTAMPPATPKPSARPQDFPPSKGKTLTSLREGLPSGPILAPTTAASLEAGTNRVAFALRDRANKLISGVPVALYTTNHDGTGARGPYVARSESLKVKPQFESRNTAQDPEAAKSIYVADVPLRAKRQVITGVARLDGRLVATTGFELPVPRKGLKGRPPEVGAKAIAMDTPTITSVGGDASKISTRVPPAEPMLKQDFATVLGKKPVVLMFATPQLCQSRICGPVVDVGMQVQARYGDKVTFIQQEIYKDNQVDHGFTDQVAKWRLPTEPWTFVIDRAGRISARFEGAVSVGELDRAVAKVAAPA
jgi:hypothetical protein